MLRIVIAGATGWAGSALTRAVVSEADLDLVAGVARRSAGRSVGRVLEDVDSDAPLVATLEEALVRPSDVVVDYASADVARRHAEIAIEAGRHLVIGSSGLGASDYEELDRRARERDVGVLAVGNFSFFAMLLERFAREAARYADAFEVFDYAGPGKPDAPSGTAREVAALLAESARPPKVPIDAIRGAPAARGATLDGTQVHAVRLPGYVLSTEVALGRGDQRLSIRHDAGASADAYVPGALLAIRRVGRLRGLHRGLGAVVDPDEPVA
jgi:4-hydroxy-tetrahydrodipicolinate reductase